MRASAYRSGGVVAAAVLAASLASAAPAAADDPSTWGINGVYETLSNGEWAKRHDSFWKVPVVRNTWTISTQCTSPVDCAGTVVSSDGWEAPIYTTSGVWYVKRTVPNWIPCEDGSTADGLQTFRIYPTEWETGYVDYYSMDLLTGEDHTVGPSGACGHNLVMDIRMPFRAQRAS